jgi:hypothetical protein
MLSTPWMRWATFFLLIMASGCAHRQGSMDWGDPIGFTCANGTRFSVEYQGRFARITTRAGTWILEETKSSIGRRFVGESAAFIHDEDRAALNGLAGGPFRRCRQGGLDR